MRAKHTSCWLFNVCAIFLILSLPCWAQDAGHEKIGNYGYIDWINQKVVAKGTGAPPAKYYGKPQARPMAMRAATSDARRNLLEVIKGVHIDSTTTVVKRLTEDDTIITRVKGELRSSTVDDIQYMSDGTVEAVVSMPLTGRLSTILLKAPTGPTSSRKKAVAAGSIEKRMHRLEGRVKALEAKLTGLNKVSYEQKEMLTLLGQFVATWTIYDSTRPRLIAAVQGDDSRAALMDRLARQEKRLVDMSGQLMAVSSRVAVLEGGGAPRKAAAASKVKTLYTGLVIDARGLGFRPCLKPEIFGPSDLLYPGDYVDAARSVRGGFVRYYRKIGRAQQSSRAGKLPYTIKATGVYQGQRSLQLGEAEFKTLKSISIIKGSFLQSCNVVIVF